METVDLEKMTAVELRELALKEYPEITGVHAMKKEELVAAVHKARGEVVKDSKKKKAKTAVKTNVDKKELKKQIRQLKTEKVKLLEGQDKKSLSRIRKKIKRLKRLTKKAA
ncbi:MAG: Rho termination factor N-terminal domain-containing protein [Thermodesulfobacteriota bacterium]